MSIVSEIREEIKAAYREPTKRDLNVLALIFLGLPGLIGAYLVYWKGSANGYMWIGVGAALVLCRLVPPLFRLIYRVWVSFSIILGYFVSRVLLTVIFFVVIVPTGFIMKIFAKDPMDRKLDPDATTYWQKKEQESDVSVERYQKQF
jgi:Saxitoxin biosynthesis operon protein SxtJ